MNGDEGWGRVNPEGVRGAQRRGGEEGLAGRTACTRPRIRKALGTFQEQRGAREAPCSRRGGRGVGGSRPSPGPKAQACLCACSQGLCFCDISVGPLRCLAGFFFLCPLPLCACPKALSKTPVSALWFLSPWPPPPLLLPQQVSSSFSLCSLWLRMNGDARGWVGVEAPGLDGAAILWGCSSWYSPEGGALESPSPPPPRPDSLLGLPPTFSSASTHVCPHLRAQLEAVRLPSDQQGRRAPGMPAGPAQGKMVHRDPAFPSQAPYCRERANFLSGLGRAPDRGLLRVSY